MKKTYGRVLAPRKYSVDQNHACEQHEQCRQHFISAQSAACQHLDVGQMSHARYELLRANASVAQGLVWAEIIGIDPAGWIARMEDIDRLWERAQS